MSNRNLPEKVSGFGVWIQALLYISFDLLIITPFLCFYHLLFWMPRYIYIALKKRGIDVRKEYANRQFISRDPICPRAYGNLLIIFLGFAIALIVCIVTLIVYLSNGHLLVFFSFALGYLSCFAYRLRMPFIIFGG